MFKNKVVVITGATGGIGSTIVSMLAKDGAKLVLVDLSLAKLEKLSKDLGLTTDNYLLVEADVSKEEQVKKYVDKAVEKYGTIDAFINNAGVEGKVASIMETTSDNLDLVLNVNVKGVYYGLKYVMPVMIENKKGSIVNTSSVAGLMGSPGLAPYVASKHAVIGITKTAALEVAPFNVRVNAVCPGPVDNRMMESIEEGTLPGHGNDIRDEFRKIIPMGRYSTNEEVANLMLFLISDKAIGITGVSYRVDGGMGAK
ncbi:MAG: SDR family NAD(P)-dependent oxidoreductase [Bacilli bacterium]|nr:SDR family NAD(P)-dependent oxidoreductase [Bacilli bacterium]